MVDRIDGTFAIVRATRYICPETFDLRLDSIDIDVPDHDDSLIVRSIPFMVVIAERLVFKVVDYCGVADHVAFGILRAGIHFGVHLFPYTAAGSTSGTPFLQNDTTLRINLFVQQQQSAAPVVHHQQRAIHNTLTVRGHIRETVNGLVNRGIGIDVSSEIDTHGLEVVDDSFSRKMLGTVECHVLQEVRQAVLVVFLQNSSHRLGDMELRALFGLLVMTDVIG